MTRPLVSIIIPCYNAEKWVAQAIQSALDQTWPNKEVIVIDDGSTDTSLQVIKSFGDKIRWETGVNRGGCAARNRGLELARGNYVKFLDADDLLASECVARQVILSESVPSNVIVFGNSGGVIGFDNSINPVVNGAPTIEERDDPVAYLLANIIVTPCVLHRTEWLKAVGGFRIGLRKGQEQELHLRLALAGVKFRKEEGIVFYHRYHTAGHRISVAHSITNDPDANYEILRLTEEHLRKAHNDSIPSNLKLLLGRSSWSLGREMMRSGHQEFAARCFRKALELGPGTVVGSSLYRVVVALFGPILAEKGFEVVKKCLRKLGFGC
ncbi:MAG TPA: glycosyltransferase [Verrucomicrobiota bacterium]|nr:glycosyltransferase [Verrucomicrobiota bacterium]